MQIKLVVIVTKTRIFQINDDMIRICHSDKLFDLVKKEMPHIRAFGSFEVDLKEM